MDKQVLSKIVTVDSLPRCNARTYFKLIVEDPSTTKVVVAAAMIDKGTWSAFVGWPGIGRLKLIHQSIPIMQWSCSVIRTTDEVLATGDKLSKEAAVALFPEWKGMRYK
jgi:hypothetical protein